jgi:hypothetical protein
MSVAISSRRGEAGHGLAVRTPRRVEGVPYLRLVVDQAAVPVQRRSEEAAHDVPRAAPAEPRPIRLTRRGRAVLWLLLLVSAVAAMALLAPASQAASPSGPLRTVTVHSGDTMWSIATRMLPDASPNVAVDRIRVLNHLHDNEVYVGEQLLIPAA